MHELFPLHFCDHHPIARMKLSDFDFHLPQELIALYPPKDRPSAKLLCVDRNTGERTHRIFRDISDLLRSGDVLVLNDTKVIPARLFARKETGGQVEAFLIKRLGERRWEVLLRPGRRVKKGARLLLEGDGLQKYAVVLDDGRQDSCQRILEFAEDCSFEDIKALGHIPLPPYINRPDEPLDREVYQTVFAREEGAVASPTAGLHFDQLLLKQLQTKGIEVVTVTLHVGYGTFQTIPVEELSEHHMFEESFELTEEVAQRINLAQREKRRIIACGTTVVRTLESCVDASGQVRAQQGNTRLFIYPSYEFKVPSGMITNFHLPKSSLLLLVAAFLGWDKTREAYEEAVRQQYRFYSYGDAMLIV